LALPETLLIGGMTFTVKEEETRDMVDKGAWGETNYIELIIRVRPDLADDMKLSVMAHEIMHVLFLTSGANLPHDEEEKLVSGLESVLFRFLRENDLSWIKIK
jgi:predicted metallopeptidase